MILRDAARLVVGTLTVLPTRPPRTVDREVGGRAMALAPLVGGALALLTSAALWLLDAAGLAPLPTAAAVVGLLALLTRAMHLDGLADTADGLGSGRPAAQALEIMRRGDVGPFGVVTLVLVLLLQVGVLAGLVADGVAAPALATALVVSRLALPLSCRRSVPAARRDGLGSAVAGSVGPGLLAVAAVLAAGVLALVAIAAPTPSVVPLLAVAAAGLVAATVVCDWAVRRLGGVTGDVLGACVEVAFTAALVIASLPVLHLFVPVTP